MSNEHNNLPDKGTEIKPRSFNSKRNIIIIIIATILLIGGGITAIAVTSSHSVTSGVADKIQLAERYLSEQNYEQAIIEFQKVLEIEPMNVDAYLGLADAYMGMSDTDKALETLQKGLETTGNRQLQKHIVEILNPPVMSSSTSSSSTSSEISSSTSTSFETFR